MPSQPGHPVSQDADSELPTPTDALPTDPLSLSLLLAHPALPHPLTPLSSSYTYHSPLPTCALEEHGEGERREKPGFMLGVDEAGRGPALGPMVYAAAYCPVEWKAELDTLGFNDSKVLSPETRARLLTTLSSHPAHLGWSVRVLSPSAISAGMLSRPNTNLNVQSQNATVALIRALLAAGVRLTEIYVDALGPSVPYQAYLQSLFPTCSVTVQPKADAIYPIVGAASVAAKTTRDAWMESWAFEEAGMAGAQGSAQAGEEGALGSGYPSDPKTQAWIAKQLERTFGYPRLVRFSWAPIRLAMEKNGHAVKWIDDNQASVVKSFASATGRDKGRCNLAKDLGLRSICDI